MGVMLILVAGGIVFIMAIYSAVSIMANKVTAPTKALNEEISQLKRRINELENNQEQI